MIIGIHTRQFLGRDACQWFGRFLWWQRLLSFRPACGPLAPESVRSPTDPDRSGRASRRPGRAVPIFETHPVGSGLGVAVRWRGETILAKGYGFADREAGTAVDERTVFGIGSMTKQFTAASILQLVDAGKFTLDTDVRQLLPEAQLTHGPLTIRQLLSHTSGLPEYMPTSESEADLIFSPASQATLVKRYAAKPLEFAPGTNWGYSNSNFQLLALVVEKVFRPDFDHYLRAARLRPGGLEELLRLRSRPRRRTMAKGYAVDPTGKVCAGARRQLGLGLRRWQHLRHGSGRPLLERRSPGRSGIVSPASLTVMETAVRLDDGTPHHLRRRPLRR